MIFNQQLEQNIIGAILHMKGYGEAVEDCMTALNASDFYAVAHKEIFLIMKDLMSRDILPDVESVNAHHDCLSSDELYLQVNHLAMTATSGLNLNRWTGQLKQVSQLRTIQQRVNSINEIISSSDDVSIKLSSIDDIFSTEVGIINESDGAKHISNCMTDYIDMLEKRWNNPDEVIFTTGIPDLDDVFGGGLEVGLHAIAARPKQGKTELMGKMINHFAVTRGLPVYVGSLEMSNYQVIERLVSSYGKIDKNQIKNNFKDMHDHDLSMGAFMQSCGDVGHSDVYIQDSSNNTPKRIRREARKILKTHGRIGGVFIDYLGLCDADGKHDRHDLAIGSMTKAFKALSKELNCPVILLLQLSRKLEARTDKRPIPSDSRDSGSIEQDVDSWTAIYRDSVYNEDSVWNGITEIIVRLNRHGGTGTAYQTLNGAGFSNVSEHEVAKLLHMEEIKPASNKTSGF